MSLPHDEKPMFSEPVINLLLQIPLAGVVAFVVWMFLKHLRQSEERQDNAQTRMIEFIGAQEENNRLFLHEQNEMHAQGMQRLAEEIKSIGMKMERLDVRRVRKNNRNS